MRDFDIETRCWYCCKWRYFDVNDGGQFIDDVWQCDTCIQKMTDKPVKHYSFSPALLKWRSKKARG